MNDIPLLPRILAAIGKLLLFGVVFFLITALLGLPLIITKADDFEWYPIVSTYIQIASLAITIGFFYKYIDHKNISELGLAFRKHVKELLAGSGIATLIMVAGFVVLLLLKQLTVASVGFDLLPFLSGFVLFVGVSVFEEVLCRGYMLSTLMGAMNKYVAWVVSSLLFAALHLANDHMALLPFINLFLAGLLLGSAYIYTRNLWFAIGMHLFWNFVQGTVLGFNVSGSVSYSAVRLHYPEMNVLNGGDFGFEGSWLCSLFTLAAILAVVTYYEIGKGSKQLDSEKEDEKDMD